MYNQDTVKSMISILERQISELKEDLANVEHSITKDAIKLAITELEQSLSNVKEKLIK